MQPGEFASVLTGAKAGAAWALESLWSAFHRPVVGYLRAQGASEPDDLTSEVFVGAFRNLQEFAGDESQFRSWLFTIAHRRLIDERRRVGRRPRLVALEPGVHDEPAPSSGESLVLGESNERVRELLETLPPAQRDVLLLRVVAGLDAEETAAILGKKPGTVRVVQHRALSALRKQLSTDV